MNCEGCKISGKGQNAALESAYVAAKKYAQEKETSIAVYKEGFEYHIEEARSAIARGVPIIHIFSQYN